MKRHLLVELIRFGIVGGLSVCLQFLVLITAVEVFGVNPTLSSALGFSIACTSSYLALYYWTFKSDGKHHLVALRYICVMSFSMLLNLYIFWLFTETLEVWYVASRAIATCCSATCSFFLNKNYTFL